MKIEQKTSKTHLRAKKSRNHIVYSGQDWKKLNN